MLNLPPSVRLFVATEPVDGRKGPDSLMVMARDAFELDVFSGHLFIFFSKRRDRVRMVYWDRDGIAMWTKRLERGRYRLQRSDAPIRCIDASDLSLILEGMTWRTSGDARDGSRDRPDEWERHSLKVIGRSVECE